MRNFDMNKTIFSGVLALSMAASGLAFAQSTGTSSTAMDPATSGVNSSSAGMNPATRDMGTISKTQTSATGDMNKSDTGTAASEKTNTYSGPTGSGATVGTGLAAGGGSGK
jgi:hypothetical protein